VVPIMSVSIPFALNSVSLLAFILVSSAFPYSSSGLTEQTNKAQELDSY
jgi:hypothetical protein